MPRFRFEGPWPCKIFCLHELCMNYVTNTILLVRSSKRSKKSIVFLHGQYQKSKQKPTTKNFVGFDNHSPPLTMIKRTIRSLQVICSTHIDEGFLGPGCWGTRVLKTPVPERLPRLCVYNKLVCRRFISYGRNVALI